MYTEHTRGFELKHLPPLLATSHGRSSAQEARRKAAAAGALRTARFREDLWFTSKSNAYPLNSESRQVHFRAVATRLRPFQVLEPVRTIGVERTASAIAFRTRTRQRREPSTGRVL